MNCPSCRIPMNIQSAKCPQCHASFTGDFQVSFLNCFENGELRAFLALIAARGKVNGVASLLKVHRNSAATVLADLKNQMYLKASGIKHRDPLAAEFVSMCDTIDLEENKPSNSEEED